jgi:hypothetical protein
MIVRGIDTTNDSMVGVRADRIAILALGVEMPKDKALRLAAWLVALADGKNEFAALLDAVRNT